jgi:hypothetical protein
MIFSSIFGYLAFDSWPLADALYLVSSAERFDKAAGTPYYN